ncbi:MAG: glycosyltransferase [Patescibacteria group bacterium]|jgi:hypothetical protein
MNSKKLFNIIYLTEDGITETRCGVGTIAQNFAKSWSNVRAYFAKRGILLSLFVISLSDTKRNSSNNFYIKRRKSLNNSYFDLVLWKEYNKEAIGIIHHISDNNSGENIVLANDSIFAGVLTDQKNLINVWIPHSLAGVHKQSYCNEKDLRSWEDQAISKIKKLPNYFLGSISKSVDEIIKKKLAIPNNKVIQFRNGLNFNELKKYTRLTKQQIKLFLAKKKIPLDKKIIFSYARADEYKGLDFSLNCMIQFCKKHDDFIGILIASSFSDEAFIEKIQNNLAEIAKDNSQIYLFFDYEPDLPKYLLRYSNTKFLINMPLRDFSPIVPNEAVLISHKDLYTINSNIQCFTSIIQNWQNGFLCKHNTKELIKLIELIMNNKNKAVEVKKKEKVKVLSSYNIEKNYISGFSEIIISR